MVLPARVEKNRFIVCENTPVNINPKLGIAQNIWKQYFNNFISNQ